MYKNRTPFLYVIIFGTFCSQALANQQVIQEVLDGTSIPKFAGPVPVVLLILAAVCAWYYPITRDRHRALLDQIAEREAE